MSKLSEQKCVPCDGDMPPLTKGEARELLKDLDDEWELDDNHQKIHRRFKFKNFYQTMSLVNAIAWIANNENHHPDLQVGYNYCDITFTTHAIKGLSQNDFICAAKIDNITS